MSYILDALKRADAERERGQVPGLHSQASAPLPTATHRRTATGWPAQALLGLCLLALVGIGLWWFTTRPTTPAPVLATAPEPATPTAPAPTPVVTPQATAPAGPVVPSSPAVTAAMPTAVPPLLRPEPPMAAVTPTQDTPTRTTGASSRQQPAPPKDRDLDASDAGVRRFADLSPEQRAQLPQLNVNGASYSANPAHRMLIVNGAVVHEGQEVAPDLVLERIGLHQAVLRQGGLRFSIAY